MFDRALIEDLVDEYGDHPYQVRLLSPYSAEIRPVGFHSGDGGYRVLIERRAFGLHVSLVSDPMAIGLRAAVVGGVSSQPMRLEKLRQEMAASSWAFNADFDDGAFVLEAKFLALDESLSEQLRAGVQAAVRVSRFILDQLVVTKRYGEMRASVPRQVGDGTDESDPWMYDPDARDRATARHRALENWLIETLREEGLMPLDPASEPFFDVAWKLGDTLVVCEVKTTGSNPAMQLRLGLGQVLHYKAQLELGGWVQVVPALLVEEWHPDDAWLRLTESLGVVAFDPSRWIAARANLGVPGSMS